MSIVTRAKAVAAAFQASIPGRVLQRYGQDKCDVFAASIAFTTLFSMVPVILGVLVIVGLAVADPAARANASKLVLAVMPSESGASVLDAMSGISDNTRLFGLLTAFGVVSAGTSLFRTVEAALNQVYQARSRALPRQVLLAIGTMVLFALLVIAQLVSASVMQFIGDYVDSLPFAGPWTAPALTLAGVGISLVTAFVFSFAVYYVVPNLRLSVRHTLPGAVLLSIALVVLSQIFPLYIRYLSGFNRYGAILGLFFVLLTWAHLVADFLMLGAELNAELRPVSAAKEARAEKPLVR